MLKKLKRKMVLINLTLVSIVLLLAMVIVCGATVNSSVQELYRSLRQEASLEPVTEQLPAQLGQQEDPPSHPASVPHITAIQTEDGQWNILADEQVSIASETLIRALIRVQEEEKEEGLFMGLRLAYVRRYTPSGTLVVLGDTSMVRVTLWNSLLVCAAVFLGGIAVFFAISVGLSNMAVKPIEDAWRRQKQFIADASHELKTPLTVILANQNIISAHGSERVDQQAQWLHSTAEEAEQMRILIDEMLTLARTEDQQATIPLQSANISDLIEEELLFLEPVAFEKNVTLVLHIQKDITWVTNEALLKKLTVILVDNAIKHGSTGTPVTITLSCRKAPALSIHNLGPAIAQEDLPHLFDRFYRSDKSRSTSGHGLGLAIAQAISRQLKGTLTVASSEEYGTTFTVEFKG